MFSFTYCTLYNILYVFFSVSGLISDTKLDEPIQQQKFVCTPFHHDICSQDIRLVKINKMGIKRIHNLRPQIVNISGTFRLDHYHRRI